MHTQITDNAARPSGKHPRGPMPGKLTLARFFLYAGAVFSALLFIAPLWVTLVTSFKTMAEIRSGGIFSWPMAPTLEPWVQAWSSACTGLVCEGVKVGFINSFLITLPSVALAVLLGALNGYIMTFWKPKGYTIAFSILVLGAFVPLQIFIYPLTRLLSTFGIFGSLAGIVAVHVIFGMPIMTLLFRSAYEGVPQELFKAARIDGAGFWQIFGYVILPLSVPMIVVATIIQFTGVWNDYLLGLIFGGGQFTPMTVQLNNIINSTTGERAYNVEMAATVLTALVPLAIYLFSGKFFVRGITAGAVKG